MDEEAFHQLIIRELTAIHEKIDSNHRRIDNIAQELVRIDTERKTQHVMQDSQASQSQWGWEKALGIIGALGLGAGIIISLI
jgi:frataxin-like iron-binding protein CyaY